MSTPTAARRRSSTSNSDSEQDATAALDDDSPIFSRAASESTSTSHSSLDDFIDQSVSPPDLTTFSDASLFNVWRSKARVMGRKGWLNDPMCMWQRSEKDGGGLHAGWQANLENPNWGNICMASATSNDFGVTWTDLNKTLWPSEKYDAGGVFDGTIIENGHDGYPSILYTSINPDGPLGATVEEVEGVETQSIAYTKDGGASWIKLPTGAGGNPVIYKWPMQNLTGFRDPYVFRSPKLASLLPSTRGQSDTFVTLSGGVRREGSKIFLYRQNKETSTVLHWDYVGVIFETGLNESWSEWSGNYGINFETASVNRLSAQGDASDDDSDSAVDFFFFGTEGARDQVHQQHWALWSAVRYSTAGDGATVTSTILYSGVSDYGSAYAFVNFPFKGSNGVPRQVSVGWTYEAASDLNKQMGYQGAFTTFRDVFVKSTPNIDPTDPDLDLKASWGVKTESDGSVTVSTLGQRVVPEVLTAWKAAADVSAPVATSLVTEGYRPFDVQPTGRYYVIKGRFDSERDSSSSVGFRVLASDQEYTDILYDPVAQELTVVRAESSLVKSFDHTTELGKLKLWRSANSSTTTLNLIIIVDNSVVEVHANDETIITTRVYPWLSCSKGAGLLASRVDGSPVEVSELELWDGLVDAWPNRR